MCPLCVWFCLVLCLCVVAARVVRVCFVGLWLSFCVWLCFPFSCFWFVLFVLCVSFCGVDCGSNAPFGCVQTRLSVLCLGLLVVVRVVLCVCGCCGVFCLF